MTFWAGSTQFLLLTDRQDVTTFQVMVLYAYRWQVELLFRFLKRTMNGIHLVNHSQDGVTIQFYMLLIVSLFQLRLKQQAMSHHDPQEVPETHETRPAHDTPDTPTTPAAQGTPEAHESHPGQGSAHRQDTMDASAEICLPALHQLPSEQGLSHPYRFFDMIGEKLTTYWKLGIHWLSTLRQILHYPFNEQALELLDSG